MQSFKGMHYGIVFCINFCIPTVFDIIPLELVRFLNSVSLCSRSCSILPFSLSFLHSNVEVIGGPRARRPWAPARAHLLWALKVQYYSQAITIN
jgi:hypothetical protein